MADPTSASIVTYFSITKLWGIVSGVCGSIIPILALADKTKITLSNAFFMALTGSSFSIFVGPWLSEKFGIVSIEGTVALSWILGAIGVYLVRAVFKWLEQRGAQTIDGVVTKALGITQSPPMPPYQSSTDDNANHDRPNN